MKHVRCGTVDVPWHGAVAFLLTGYGVNTHVAFHGGPGYGSGFDAGVGANGNTGASVDGHKGNQGAMGWVSIRGLDTPPAPAMATMPNRTRRRAARHERSINQTILGESARRRHSRYMESTS